jgi:hypothetical protein
MSLAPSYPPVENYALIGELVLAVLYTVTAD